MEQDVEIRDDSFVIFDDRILNKLRGCDIVPKTPEDFQAFVKSLAGDTISDVVVQEVWKQIYPNETGHVSISASGREPESQKLAHALHNSSKSDVSEFLNCSSRKVPKQRPGSCSGVNTFKKTEITICENEAQMSDLDVRFSDVATSVRNQSIALHSFVPVSRSKVNRKISCPIKTRDEVKQTIPGEIMTACVPWEEDQTEEESSSDCEIIKVVSPERSGASNSTSGSERVPDDDGKTSDSDESVKILGTANSVVENVNRPCPIHGSNATSNYQNSQERTSTKRKSMMTEAATVESNDNENCEESVNKGKQQKDKRKGKKKKNKTLRSEVKHLKSLLVNLLLTLKSPTSTDSRVKNDCGNRDNLDFILLNGQKSRKSNGSFGSKQGRKKSGRTVSTEKLEASAFVEVNMSRKTTRSSPKKKETAKRFKNSREVPPTVVELDSDTSDVDNRSRKKFPWRENIADVLRSKAGRWMSVEKLKRIIVAKYYYSRGNVSQNTTVKFFRYLHSTAGVVVDGDKAMYSNTPIIKVSSKSKSKQIVLKTHTTTKEYKVS